MPTFTKSSGASRWLSAVRCSQPPAKLQQLHGPHHCTPLHKRLQCASRTVILPPPVQARQQTPRMHRSRTLTVQPYTLRPAQGQLITPCLLYAGKGPLLMPCLYLLVQPAGTNTASQRRPANTSQQQLMWRHRSAAERLTRSWVRIPPEAWTFVSCECLCCQVEVSATGRSLVQRSPTACGVCPSVIKCK
jgi:hypothetical protein